VVNVLSLLLRPIDRIAKAFGLARSAEMVELEERDAAQAPEETPAAGRTLGRLDELFAQGPAEDSASAIRAERDAR
jgi:hypothetical protein